VRQGKLPSPLALCDFCFCSCLTSPPSHTCCHSSFLFLSVCLCVSAALDHHSYRWVNKQPTIPFLIRQYTIFLINNTALQYIIIHYYIVQSFSLLCAMQQLTNAIQCNAIQCVYCVCAGYYALVTSMGAEIDYENPDGTKTHVWPAGVHTAMPW
jgi:hypothetical protein